MQGKEQNTTSDSIVREEIRKMTPGRKEPSGVRRGRDQLKVVVLGSVLGGLLIVSGLLVGGCYDEHSKNRGVLSPEAQAADIPMMSMADLPSDLNLTSDQKSQLEAALGQLRQARQEMGPARRGHRGQKGDRSGPPPDAPFAGGEPPIMVFLEKASTILTPDQFTILAKTMAGRREEMQARFHSEANGGRPAMPPRAARRLGLSEDQQTKIDAALAKTGEQMRALWKSLDGGTMTAEQAKDQAKTIRTAMKTEMQSILTAEQWAKIEKFRQDGKERGVDRRLDNLGQNLDRRAEFTGRVLGLDEQQTAQVKQILQATIPLRSAVLEKVKAGAIEPEDAAFDVWQIEKDAAGQIRALLTPPQAQRFDALAQLLPKGPRGGPGMGMSRFGMGGPGGMGRDKGGPGRGHSHRGWRS